MWTFWSQRLRLLVGVAHELNISWKSAELFQSKTKAVADRLTDCGRCPWSNAANSESKWTKLPFVALLDTKSETCRSVSNMLAAEPHHSVFRRCCIPPSLRLQCSAQGLLSVLWLRGKARQTKHLSSLEKGCISAGSRHKSSSLTEQETVWASLTSHNLSCYHCIYVCVTQNPRVQFPKYCPRTCQATIRQSHTHRVFNRTEALIIRTDKIPTLTWSFHFMEEKKKKKYL